MVDFGTSWLLAGHHLSSVSAAEALVLPLFGRQRLLLLPAVAPPPQLAALIVGRRVVLFGRRRVSVFLSVSWKEPVSGREPHLWPHAQEAAAVC